MHLVVTSIPVVHIHARSGITVVPWVVLCMGYIPHTCMTWRVEWHSYRKVLVQSNKNQGTELQLNSEGEALTKAQATYKY